MKLIKFIKAFLIVCTLAFAAPVAAHAFAVSSSAAAGPGDSSTLVLSRIVSRVNEIQQMDKSKLSASEKKALRKELKEMKRTAEGLDSKIYISVGAVIIIILLLILILK